MDNNKFREIYSRMKAEGEQADALLHDRWETYRDDVQDAHSESLDRIQADLEFLVQHELKIEQLEALRNVRFHTGRTDVECDGISVLRPEMGEGVFASALNEADQLGMGFEARLFGLSTAQVQGTRSGYMDVMIERPKTTNKNK